jgi:hypothetical protein
MSFKKSFRVIACLLTLGCLLVLSTTSFAQPPYKELSYPPWVDSPAEKGKVRFEVMSKIANSTSSPSTSDKENLKKWFVDYHVRGLTHLKTISKCPDRRAVLLKELRVLKAQGARDYVNSLLLNTAKVLTEDNYHPACRVNAMLVAGELDAQPLNQIKKQLPKPSPQGTDFLIESLDNVKLDDGIKVAALVGLVRHANYGWATMSAVQRNDVQSKMIALLTAAAPQGRDGATHVWMQRRAIDVLGSAKVTGQDGEAVKAMLGLIENPQSPASLRCSVYLALGKLAFKGQATPTAKTQKATLDFATKTCELERKMIEEGLKKFAPRPAPDFIADRAKRRMVYVLNSIRTGIVGESDGNGIANAMAQADAANAGKVATELQTLIDNLNNGIDASALQDAIARGENGLRQLNGVAPAAPAAPADDPTAPATPPPTDDEDLGNLLN